MAQLYGVYNEERGVANRAVIVIDKAGTVRFRHLYNSASDLDIREILAEVDTL